MSSSKHTCSKGELHGIVHLGEVFEELRWCVCHVAVKQ